MGSLYSPGPCIQQNRGWIRDSPGECVQGFTNSAMQQGPPGHSHFLICIGRGTPTLNVLCIHDSHSLRSVMPAWVLLECADTSVTLPLSLCQCFSKCVLRSKSLARCSMTKGFHCHLHLGNAAHWFILCVRSLLRYQHLPEVHSDLYPFTCSVLQSSFASQFSCLSVCFCIVCFSHTNNTPFTSDLVCFIQHYFPYAWNTAWFNKIICRMNTWTN